MNTHNWFDRFLSVDPLADKFPNWSPYNYTENNPVNKIDPLGLSPTDWVKGAGGMIVWDEKVTSATDEDLNGREYLGKEGFLGDDFGVYYGADGVKNLPLREVHIRASSAQGGGGASLIYQRTTETDQSTTGSFYIPGTKISGYILEPAGPSTTKSGLDRRIPAGTYNVIKNTGSKYGLRLYNDQVPQSRAILMHIGNYPGDTEGCLLPGSSIGPNFVGGSGPMINQIMNYFNQTGYTGATITIYDIKGP